MLPIGGLSREHDAVGAVKNGIGHIAALGASWAGVGNHRLEHLSGGDDRFAGDVGLTDHHLLGEKHLLWGNFHSQIPASDHDAISDIENFVVVFEPFLVLFRG